MAVKTVSNIPTGPCLLTALDDSGEVCPIIPGMMLAINMDPLKPGNAMPFRLVSVKPNEIVLMLKTSDGGIVYYPFKCTKKILMNKAAKDTHKKSQS